MIKILHFENHKLLHSYPYQDLILLITPYQVFLPLHQTVFQFSLAIHQVVFSFPLIH